MARKLEEIEAEAHETVTLRIGDFVRFHDLRGDCPALIQHIHPDGSLRLWVFGISSMFNRDGVVEGTDPGLWSRR